MREKNALNQIQFHLLHSEVFFTENLTLTLGQLAAIFSWSLSYFLQHCSEEGSIYQRCVFINRWHGRLEYGLFFSWKKQHILFVMWFIFQENNPNSLSSHPILLSNLNSPLNSLWPPAIHWTFTLCLTHIIATIGVIHYWETPFYNEHYFWEPICNSLLKSTSS